MTDPDPATTAAFVAVAAALPWASRNDILAAIDAVRPGITAGAQEAERQRLAAVIPPERFRLLADWFDIDDRLKAEKFPGLDRGDDVQADLRRFADLLDDPASEGHL